MSGSNRSEGAKPYQERTVSHANPRQPKIVTRDAFVSPEKGPAEQLRIIAEIVVNYRAYVVVRGAAFSDGTRLPPNGMLIRNLKLTVEQGGTYADRRSHRFMHVPEGLYYAIRQVAHIQDNNRGERQDLGEMRGSLVWLLQAVCTLHQEDDEGVRKFVEACLTYTEEEQHVKDEKKVMARQRIAQAGEITLTPTGKIWNTPMKGPLVWSSEHLLRFRQGDLDQISLRFHPLAIELTQYLDQLLDMFSGCETYLNGVMHDASVFKDRPDKNAKRLGEAKRLRLGARELRVINVKPFTRICRRTANDMLAAAEHLEFAAQAAEAGDRMREQNELKLARKRLDCGRRSMLLMRLYDRQLEQILFVISQLKHMKRALAESDRDRLVEQLTDIRDHLRDDGLDRGFARPFLRRVVAHLNAALDALLLIAPDIVLIYNELKAACAPF